MHREKMHLIEKNEMTIYKYGPLYRESICKIINGARAHSRSNPYRNDSNDFFFFRVFSDFHWIK